MRPLLLNQVQKDLLDHLVEGESSTVTAPELSERIGKSMEHCSLMLRNLWIMDYLERDGTTNGNGLIYEYRLAPGIYD